MSQLIQKIFTEVPHTYKFLNHLLTPGQDMFWRLVIVAKRGLISKNIKGVIDPQLLIIKHGHISDHQTDYPTAMSEGKKRDI